jgi:rhamnogalacturonyl hydrolase YesR
MKRFLSPVLASVFAFGLWAAATTEFDKDSIISICSRVGGCRMNTFGAKSLDNLWQNGVYFTGVMALYKMTGNQKYLDSSTVWAQARNWDRGNSTTSNPNNVPRDFADNHACCQTYCELFMHNPVPANAFMYLKWESIWDTVSDIERKKGAALWWWCDALFMDPPAIALLSHLTGTVRYLDTMNVYWWSAAQRLYDTAAHLYFRDSSYFYPKATTSHGNKVFWSRGNGWVAAGMARVLEYMPADFPDRPKYVQQFKDMSAALKACQGGDGMWRTSLFDTLQYPAPEMSGTCFYCFSIAWGINNGILDRTTYEPVVRKAWSGMVGNVKPSGALTSVQAVGSAPGPTLDTTMPYAEGAFCLAGNEMCSLVTATSVMHPGGYTMEYDRTRAEIRPVISMYSSHAVSAEISKNSIGYEIFTVQGKRLGRVMTAGKTHAERISLPPGCCIIRFIDK